MRESTKAKEQQQLSQEDTDAAVRVGLALLGNNSTKAEMQLLELFQQRERELKRKEEERIALSKIISKGCTNYTTTSTINVSFVPTTQRQRWRQGHACTDTHTHSYT